jgi:hypothetical protein
VHAFVCRWEIQNAQLQEEWHGEKEGAHPSEWTCSHHACIRACFKIFSTISATPPPPLRTHYIHDSRRRVQNLALLCWFARWHFAHLQRAFSEGDLDIACHYTYTYIDFPAFIYTCILKLSVDECLSSRRLINVGLIPTNTPTTGVTWNSGGGTGSLHRQLGLIDHGACIHTHTHTHTHISSSRAACRARPLGMSPSLSLSTSIPSSSSFLSPRFHFSLPLRMFLSSRFDLNFAYFSGR